MNIRVQDFSFSFLSLFFLTSVGHFWNFDKFNTATATIDIIVVILDYIQFVQTSCIFYLHFTLKRLVIISKSWFIF